MSEAERGEIANCPFCDDDPLAEGHHRLQRVPILVQGGTMIHHLMLTCLNRFPEACDKDVALRDLMPYTFLLIEKIEPHGRLDETVVAREDWGFMEKLTDKLEEEQP